MHCAHPRWQSEPRKGLFLRYSQKPTAWEKIHIPKCNSQEKVSPEQPKARDLTSVPYFILKLKPPPSHTKVRRHYRTQIMLDRPISR